MSCHFAGSIPGCFKKPPLNHCIMGDGPTSWLQVKPAAVSTSGLPASLPPAPPVPGGTSASAAMGAASTLPPLPPEPPSELGLLPPAPPVALEPPVAVSSPPLPPGWDPGVELQASASAR